MYWWKDGPHRGNFGDMLGPMICEHLSGRRVVHSSVDESDLVTIGSLLEPWFWPNKSNLTYSGAVWGSGRMAALNAIAFPLASIHAVRGELSRIAIDSLPSACVTGDPALLTPLLLQNAASPPRRFKIGVIPHCSEREHPAYRRLSGLSSEIHIIDPCERVAIVVDRIRASEFILSSSLHGLVLADAFNIPSRWLRLHVGRELQTGYPEFKYRDYFSLFDSRQSDFVTLSGRETLFDLLTLFDELTIPTQRISEIQRRLTTAFPF